MKRRREYAKMILANNNERELSMGELGGEDYKKSYCQWCEKEVVSEKVYVCTGCYFLIKQEFKKK